MSYLKINLTSKKFLRTTHYEQPWFSKHEARAFISFQVRTSVNSSTFGEDQRKVNLNVYKMKGKT